MKEDSHLAGSLNSLTDWSSTGLSMEHMTLEFVLGCVHDESTKPRIRTVETLKSNGEDCVFKREKSGVEGLI